MMEHHTDNIRGRPYRVVSVIISVVIITWIALLPTVQNGFVNWDDHIYVRDNLALRKLDTSLLYWSFTSFWNGNWHPLTYLSLAADYAIGGLEPKGFHLTNLLIHSCTAVLVFLLTYRLIMLYRETPQDSLLPAAVVGLLFGIHPLHVESVAWVSERKDVLCAFFYVLSLYAYTASLSSGNRRRLVACSFICFALALMAKPMAVSLPVILLCIDVTINHFQDKSLIWRSFIVKAPFFALSLASSIVTLVAQSSGNAVRSITQYPLMMRIATACEAYVFYLIKLIIPARQSPYYAYNDKDMLFRLGAGPSIIILLLLTVIAFIAWKRKYRAWLVFWFSFLIISLPIIGIVQVGDQFAADRYMYLPSIPIFLALGIVAKHLYDIATPQMSSRFLFSTLGVILLIGLTILSRAQASVWKDSISLWSRAIAVSPGKSYIPYVGIGMAYLDQEKYQHALEACQYALTLAPLNPEVLTCTAEAAYYLKKYEISLDMYNHYLRLNPENPDIMSNRGAVLMAKGLYEPALNDFQSVLILNPLHHETRYNLAALAALQADPKLACERLDWLVTNGFKQTKNFNLSSDPSFDKIRHAPCFIQILRRISDQQRIEQPAQRLDASHADHLSK